MKKYLSVFALIAQNSIYRIFGLLLLLAAADGVLAWYWLAVKHYGIQNMFHSGNARFGLVLAIVFVLMAAVQIRCGDIYSGTSGYTVRRLAISEKAVLLLQILYNMLCWIILWGVQVLIIFVICKLYYRFGEYAGDPLSEQQMFLLFYISPLLHSLLPMEETLAWIANLVMIAELSISSAYWTVRRREKSSAADLLIGYWTVVLIFRRELGSYILNVIIIGGFLIIIAIDCWRMFFRKKEV
ncbi:MAG: hypothetical protein IKU09_02085 [Firmicutes bacterium]|nr:hypothetical protein [Bacillota bacterium]